MNWFLKVMKQYADFNGRSRRKEYWMFSLFLMVFAAIATIFDSLLSITIGSLPYGYLYFLVVVITFIPSMAVLVRRLHDVNKSGWYFFIFFIPLIGIFWLLYLLIKNGDEGSNKYGDDPKNPGNELNDIGAIQA